MKYKKMKNILVVSFLGMASLLPFSAFAATGLSVTPVSGNYSVGQAFSVSVLVSPQSDNIYTAKAELRYPANLLAVESFSFDEAWLPLKQSGYDLIDNTNGVLIKTAGYPGGLTSQAKLGTAVFRVKASGPATISIGSNSLALNDKNIDSFNKILTQGAYTLSAPQPVVESAPKQTAPAVKGVEKAVVETEVIAEEEFVELPKKMNPVALAMLSAVSVINPVVSLGIVLFLLVGLFLLPRKHWERKIELPSSKKRLSKRK